MKWNVVMTGVMGVQAVCVANGRRTMNLWPGNNH